MNKKLNIRSTVELKDGRKVHSCGFGFHFYI